MPVYGALLRAVDVGAIGKLSMTHFREMGTNAGFAGVRTYIASGNAVFCSEASEHQVKAALEVLLAECAGKPAGVIVRSVSEIVAVTARNPCKDAPGNPVRSERAEPSAYPPHAFVIGF